MAKYQSKEWRENISKALKGRKPIRYWTGKNFSEKHRENISKALKGREFTDEHRKKISMARLNGKNPMWKGDDVSYQALHDWVRRRLPKPKLCSRCKKRKAIDLANKSGEYKRDLLDWNWLCRHCHMMEDKRIKNLVGQGREQTRAMIEKMKKSLTGRKHSEETKMKISKSLKGRVSPMKGSKFSERHKQRISESLKKFYQGG